MSVESDVSLKRLKQEIEFYSLPIELSLKSKLTVKLKSLLHGETAIESSDIDNHVPMRLRNAFFFESTDYTRNPVRKFLGCFEQPEIWIMYLNL